MSSARGSHERERRETVAVLRGLAHDGADGRAVAGLDPTAEGIGHQVLGEAAKHAFGMREEGLAESLRTVERCAVDRLASASAINDWSSTTLVASPALSSGGSSMR